MRPRRFAITATDRYLGVLDAFLEQGWEPVKLFTVPTDERMASNRQVIEQAQRLKIPIQLSRLGDADLADLAARECELLVIASYQWRIGDWRAHVPRAINFHPSPLPRYRGPYPLVPGLLARESRWGVTCHKVAEAYDTGDILAARHFDVSPTDCHESLDLKTQMACRQLAAQVAGHLDALWDAAEPQGEGSHVPLWTDAERVLDFNRPVRDLDTHLRAFGNFECLAKVNDALLHVRRAVCWQAEHALSPGTLAHVDGSRFVVACLDGFVGLLEWNLLAPGMRHAAGGR